MKVSVSNKQRDLSINALSVKAIVKSLLEAENCSTDEVAIHFISSDKISDLHQEFFNTSMPTDCISFPLDDWDEVMNYHILGEVFICPQAAIRYLEDNQESHSVYQEVTLYLVHGLLHLLGYDDIESKDRQKMRRAEKRHMEVLLSKNLLIQARKLP